MIPLMVEFERGEKQIRGTLVQVIYANGFPLGVVWHGSELMVRSIFDMKILSAVSIEVQEPFG